MNAARRLSANASRVALARRKLAEHVRAVLTPLAPADRAMETFYRDAEAWRQAALREGDARALEITRRMPADLLMLVADGHVDLHAIVSEVGTGLAGGSRAKAQGPRADG